jgi:hypothetical protein
VAADVVGVIGAVLLVSSLVGVFAYEAHQAAPTTESITNKVRAAKADGLVTLRAASNPAGATMQCLPQVCAAAKTEVWLNVSLPRAPPLHYVVYLEKQGAFFPLGEMQRPDKVFTFHHAGPSDSSASTGLVIGLEISAQAPQPSWPLLTYPVHAGTTTIATTSQLYWLGGPANHTLRFAGDGGMTRLTAQFKGLPIHKDLQYRGWLMRPEGGNETWRFVGNLTASSANANPTRVDGDVDGLVPHAKDYYAEFVLSLEPTTSKVRDAPSGIEVCESEYNVKT